MNLTVLFIDENKNFLNPIVNKLSALESDWKILTAEDRNSAMKVFENSNVDVVISDISIIGKDGTHFLNEVKEEYPSTIRITLSNQASETIALKNSKVVHQALLKPINPFKVQNVIFRAISLRETLSDEELISIVNNLEALPTLPEIYVKLENEINSQKTSIEKISKIISSDPSIAAKILQLSNSAFFGLPIKITNITQALNFLGVKLIQTLILTIRLFHVMDSNHPNAIIYRNVWNHSNKTALIAQKIAKLKKLNKSEIEYSFLGGLLHDIGKLILLNNFSSEEISSIFKQNLHANVGAYLLSIWGLPEPIVEAVAFHHVPIIIHTKVISPPYVVFIANKIAHEIPENLEEADEEEIENVINEYLLKTDSFSTNNNTE